MKLVGLISNIPKCKDTRGIVTLVHLNNTVRLFNNAVMWRNILTWLTFCVKEPVSKNQRVINTLYWIHLIFLINLKMCSRQQKGFVSLYYSLWLYLPQFHYNDLHDHIPPPGGMRRKCEQLIKYCITWAVVNHVLNLFKVKLLILFFLMEEENKTMTMIMTGWSKERLKEKRKKGSHSLLSI